MFTVHVLLVMFIATSLNPAINILMVLPNNSWVICQVFYMEILLGLFNCITK